MKTYPRQSQVSQETSTRPQIPRSEWEQHPHFATQTLLLGSHRGFREISRMLIEAARNGEDVYRIEGSFHYWQSGMRGHEGYEEGKLFPYLSKKYSVSMDHLEEGHEQLHALKAEVFASFKRLAGYRDTPKGDAEEAAARTAVVEALQAYDALLNEHLAEEEEWVIPMLLELEPEEFETYYRSPIGYLLRRLDEQSTQ